MKYNKHHGASSKSVLNSIDLTFRNLDDELIWVCFLLVFLNTEIIISTPGWLNSFFNSKYTQIAKLRRKNKLEMKFFNLGNGY